MYYVYAVIQFVYMASFDTLYRKKGFKWSWFFLLLGGAVLASALALWQTVTGWLVGEPDQDTRMQAFATPILLLMFPIQSVILAKTSPLTDQLPFLKRLVARYFIYMASAVVASAALVLIVGGIAFIVFAVIQLLNG